MADTLTSPIDRRAKGPPRPGLVVVTESDAPVHRVIGWSNEPIAFGRAFNNDRSMSENHAVVAHLGEGRWRITDCGGKNGTSVNGVIVRGGSVMVDGDSMVVRMGGTIVLLEKSIERYSFGGFEYDGERVASPSTDIAHSIIAHAARDGARVLVRGETGTGKEHAAEVFHKNSRYARGPLVKRNASAITESLAEAQLFGAKRGAASGVEAQTGMIASADKGTLFLDEIGELKPALQPKLLRVLEDKMVQPLGSDSPQKVDFQFVSATNVELEAAVESGAFRRDLYMRIAQILVELPPLRERREEIPYLIAIALKGRAVRARASFVEACMLSPWKANVRELLETVRAAALDAKRRSEEELTAGHLPGWSSAPPVLEDVEEEAVVEPNDPRWGDLKRLYLQLGDAKKACDLAGVPRSTGHRWLQRAGILSK